MSLTAAFKNQKVGKHCIREWKRKTCRSSGSKHFWCCKTHWGCGSL